MSITINIPLSEGKPLPFFDMQAPLDGVTYTIQIRWNVRWNAWFMNILDDNALNVLIAGLRLVSDWPIAAYRTGRQPPGAFMLVDTAGVGADATIDSLGVRHQLRYWTAAELGL